MSAPLLVPAGNDRSWTRKFYYTINKIIRRWWWENKCDEAVERGVQDMILYGVHYWRHEK